jgi:hypothetical protein
MVRRSLPFPTATFAGSKQSRSMTFQLLALSEVKSSRQLVIAAAVPLAAVAGGDANSAAMSPVAAAKAPQTARDDGEDATPMSMTVWPPAGPSRPRHEQ